MSSTGGNKKTSSPSDLRYWQRAKMSNFAETHKARRIARHKNRMLKVVAKKNRRAAMKSAIFAEVTVRRAAS